MSRRKNQRTIVVERSGSSSLLWFVLGSALGAGLALLFAPESGEQTRRKVARKLSKLRDVADQAVEDLRDALSPEDRVHRSLAEREADEEELAAPGTPVPPEADRSERTERPRHGSASPRHELELRLAEARARRQRVLADEDEEPVA